MKIIGVAMVSNEADVIEAFVRHNLRFLDALAVLDHLSMDRTGEILESLRAEGLPLVQLHDSERAFRQAERQTGLAKRYLGESAADYCFCLDADEFIRCGSRARLEASLAALDRRACGLVPHQNYFGMGPDTTCVDPVRRLTRRLATERSVARKVVLRHDFAADPASQVSFGNHAALRVIAGKVEPWPHQLVEGVHLAHYPVRSAEQVAKKALLGWPAFRLLQPERFTRPGQAPSGHWRALFDRLAAGAPIDDALLADAIAAYAGGDHLEPVRDEDLVDDPLDARHELRYTEPDTDTALAALARWCDAMVTDANSGAFAPRR
jgi:hypothetical protein